MLLQLKIQLQDISKPAVWRRILVPDHFSLHRLHQVIQAAFGWQDCHLYEFSEKGYWSEIKYGIPPDPADYPGEDVAITDSQTTSCATILNVEGQRYIYTYDFGDNWNHTITVETILDTTAIRAELIAGKGACPPEDCGGAPGYAYLKEVLSDPAHMEYKNMRKWLGMKKGDEWDAHYVDIQQARSKAAAV